MSEVPLREANGSNAKAIGSNVYRVLTLPHLRLSDLSVKYGGTSLIRKRTPPWGHHTSLGTVLA